MRAGTKIAATAIRLAGFETRWPRAYRAGPAPPITNSSISPRDYGDKYDAKIDGQINDKMSAFLRFSQAQG